MSVDLTSRHAAMPMRLAPCPDADGPGACHALMPMDLVHALMPMDLVRPTDANDLSPHTHAGDAA
jgi:hypothetical protein